MQITLIRNGKHSENGHLTHDGIEEGIGAGLLLGNAAIGEKLNIPQVDWVLLEDDIHLEPIEYLPAKYQCPIQVPDLILTSPELAAKQMGFTVAEQLKQVGIKPDIQYNVAYFNKLASTDYKLDKDGCIDLEAAEKLYSSKQVKDTIDFIQRLEAEGKEHIVIVSSGANIHILLNLLGSEEIVRFVPKTGMAYTFFSVDATKIGQKKYLHQRRHLKNGVIRNKFQKESLFGKLHIKDITDIEWEMPNFFAMDRINRLANGGKERE